MTKIELWIKLMEYNNEDFRCELCEEIHTYMIAVRGLVRDNIKQVWLCKWCFFQGEDNE